ncbi:hypothetical protein ACP70R_046723 [Stipagrostis hirtigluma subsp. patula]
MAATTIRPGDAAIATAATFGPGAAASGSGNASRAGALPAVAPSIRPAVALPTVAPSIRPAAAASSSPQEAFLPSHLPWAQQELAWPCTQRWRPSPSTRMEDCSISSISDRGYHGTNADASACSTARLTSAPELTPTGDSHRPRTSPMMENSPVATEIEFPSGSPSAGNPTVEVVIPLLRSPTRAKRRRVSSLVARYVGGSPAVRLMSQMALSPSQQPRHTSRSPPGAALQNSQGHNEDDDMYDFDAENDNEQTRADEIVPAVDAAIANATKNFRVCLGNCPLTLGFCSAN